MTEDFVSDNQKFLENGQPFVYDGGDPDEQKLISYQMGIPELMVVTWLYGLRNEVVGMNKSLIVGVSGKHRSGKSLTAFVISKILDPTFWPRYKQRVVQTPAQFMEEIEYIRKNNIHGACIVIDEGGVLAPSEAFYEEWYKMLNQAIQISGWLNPIIFFCAVIRDNIGSKIRKLFHMQIKARRYGMNSTSLKVLELDYDDLRNKLKNKRPKIRVAGRRYMMNTIQFGRCPEYVEMAYRSLTEPVKAEMMEKFAKNIVDAGNAPSEDKKKKGRGAPVMEYDYDGSLKKLLESYKDYLIPNPKMGGKIILDQYKIKRNLSIPFRGAEEVKREAERVLNAKKVSDATV